MRALFTHLTHTHPLSLVLVVMTKAKGLKTKISHTHSLILLTHSLTLKYIYSFSFSHRHVMCAQTITFGSRDRSHCCLGQVLTVLENGEHEWVCCPVDSDADEPMSPGMMMMPDGDMDDDAGTFSLSGALAADE